MLSALDALPPSQQPMSTQLGRSVYRLLRVSAMDHEIANRDVPMAKRVLPRHVAASVRCSVEPRPGSAEQLQQHLSSPSRSSGLHRVFLPSLSAGLPNPQLASTRRSSEFLFDTATQWRDQEQVADASVFHDTLRTAVLLVAGNFTKTVMNYVHQTHVYHGDKLTRLMVPRTTRGQRGIITVSNHVSAVDDPFTLAALIPQDWMDKHKRLRWTFCAHDRCFLNAPLSFLFGYAKVLPVYRGSGIDQASMKTAIDKLNNGDWVHIFPEGTRTRDGRLGPMRAGIGKLVSEALDPPYVVPIVHQGMEHFFHPGAESSAKAAAERRRVGVVAADVDASPHALPQHSDNLADSPASAAAAGVSVTVKRSVSGVAVIVGDPIDFSDILAFHRACNSPRFALYRDIAHRTGLKLRALAAELAAQVACSQSVGQEDA